LDQAKDRPFGELRIGTPMEFGKSYFPAIVAAFRRQYPEVTFYVELGDPNTLLTRLKKGQIDFALVDVFQTRNSYSVNPDIYDFQAVAKEEIILACSKQYYDQFVNKDHSFRHLVKQDFITYQRSSQTTKAWFKHHFQKSNLSFQSVLTVDSHQAIITAIQHHVGMGVVASHLVSKEIKKGQIVRIKTAKPEIRNEISLTQLLDKIPTVTEKVFLKFLLNEIKSIGLGLEIDAKDQTR
jgi:DNA-binding transcriptional LysR family regulator